MKIIKRIGAIMLSVCCAACSLVACGGGENGGSGAAISAIEPAKGEVVSLSHPDVAEFIKDYVMGSNAASEYEGKGDHYAMKTLTLKWKAANPVDKYEVLVSLNADMSDAQTYSVKSEALRLSDLYSSTTYYWQITAGEDKSEVFTFKTADEPRTISISGVSNTRDIGGKLTADGKRVKQGVVYRGAKLDDIDETGIKDFCERYKIKTDLDLRKETEGDKSGSPAGASIKYFNRSCPYYSGDENGIDQTANYEKMAEVMRVFADSSNYPVYFHCAIGRDRTGMVAMLLLGLCGVSLDDICLDYELSFFSESGCMDGATASGQTSALSKTINRVKTYAEEGDETFADHCKRYLLTIGLTEEEISAIKANLIEE